MFLIVALIWYNNTVRGICQGRIRIRWKMTGTEAETPLKAPGELDKKAIALAAELLGDRWLLLIIGELLEGTKRFSQIQEGLEKITAQTLSGRLKLMEHCKIVTRYSYNEIPPRVEYTLTEKGLDIYEILRALSEFGEKYLLAEMAASENCEEAAKSHLETDRKE